MNVIRRRLWLRAVASFVVVSFMMLDIAMADPFQPAGPNRLLATPDRFSDPDMAQSLKIRGGLLALSLDIAKYVYGDAERKVGPLPIRLLEGVLRCPKYGFSGSLDGVDLSRVTLYDKERGVALNEISSNGEGIVLIPFTKGGSRFIIQVAPRDNPNAAGMSGREIGGISQEFVVKVVRETRRNGQAVQTAGEAISKEVMSSIVRGRRLSFVMIKTDGVSSRKEILAAFKKEGIRIVYEGSPIRFSRGMAEEFYAEHRGKDDYGVLVDYITEGDVIPILLQSGSDDAIKHVRKVVGPTSGIDKATGLEARGTIRGDLMKPSDRASQPIRNRIHASGSIDSVVREASIAFGTELFAGVLDKADLGSRPAGEYGRISLGRHLRIDAGRYAMDDVVMEDGAQLIQIPDGSSLMGVTLKGGASDMHRYGDGSVFADLRGGVIKFDSGRRSRPVSINGVVVPSSHTLMDQAYLENTMRHFEQLSGLRIPIERISAVGETLYMVHSSYCHPDRTFMQVGTFTDTTYVQEVKGFRGHFKEESGTLYLDEMGLEKMWRVNRTYLVVPGPDCTRVVVKLKEGGFIVRTGKGQDTDGLPGRQATGSLTRGSESNGARYESARRLLGLYAQEQLLYGYEALGAADREELLGEIESVDWSEFTKIYRTAVTGEGKPAVDMSGVMPSQPVMSDMITGIRDALDEGRRVLSDGASADISNDRTSFGGLVVAGGSGRRFGAATAKGIYGPVTPLGDEKFYDVLINKSLACARANGHSLMYPICFMVSNETAKDTLSYVRGLPEQVRARVMIAFQREWPLVESGLGKAFLKSASKIARGGAGHADAFDHILNPDAQVEGLVWREDSKDFVRAKVADWYRSIGVRYVQYMNVDNPLTPFGNAFIVGKHSLSADRVVERRERRAHITHIVVEKRSPADALANFLIDGNGMRTSLDYRDATEGMRASCRFGGPSIAVVTLDSLEGAGRSYWSLDKGKDYAGIADGSATTIRADKLEASSLNTPRSSNSVDIGYGLTSATGLDRDDIFAETKTRAQLLEAMRLQSRHWKKLISLALPGLRIPESTVVELPWSADHMTPRELADALARIDFASYVKEGVRLQVSRDLSHVRVIDPREEAVKLPAVKADEASADGRRNSASIDRGDRDIESDFSDIVRGKLSIGNIGTRIDGQSYGKGIAYSPDGKLFAVWDDTSFDIRDSSTGRLIQHNNIIGVEAAAFSADMRYVALVRRGEESAYGVVGAHYYTADIYMIERKLKSRSSKSEFRIGTMADTIRLAPDSVDDGYLDSPHSIAFSDDDRHLVVTDLKFNTHDNVIKTFRIKDENGEYIIGKKHDRYFRWEPAAEAADFLKHPSIRIVQDGRYLVAIDKGRHSIKFYNIKEANGSRKTETEMRKALESPVAEMNIREACDYIVSPDGRFIAAIEWDSHGTDAPTDVHYRIRLLQVEYKEGASGVSWRELGATPDQASFADSVKRAREESGGVLIEHLNTQMIFFTPNNRFLAVVYEPYFGDRKRPGLLLYDICNEDGTAKSASGIGEVMKKPYADYSLPLLSQIDMRGAFSPDGSGAVFCDRGSLYVISSDTNKAGGSVPVSVADAAKKADEQSLESEGTHLMAVGVQKPPQSFRELWRRAFERKPNPYAPTETEIVYLEAVSNMRLESEILDYDEHIARELRDMVSKWRDGAGELLLGLLKRELDMVAKEVKGRKRPVGDLDKAQLRVLKKLGDAVASSIEYHPGSAFSLDRALVERKASSLGMSQLMLIVGKSLGLDLSAIEVRVLQTGESLQMDNGHVACICYLASGRIVMLDIAKGLMSKPFRVIDEFDIDGEYLIQKDGSEASDIHRKIRIITREGVKALVHLEIAAAHERAGRYKDAIAEDTKAIIHDHEMFYAYYRRAVNHMLSGDAEEAVLDYNRALSVYPGSVETHVNRGKALYALERLGPARAAYDEAIRLKPDFEECLICRGDLLSEMGDHKGAMADFEAVLRLNPRSSQGYRGRADLYNRIGKYEESLAEFDMALEIDPDNLMALCGRGTAYGLLGRAEESRRDFKAAMAAGPKLRRIITNMAGNVGIDLGATVSGSARPGPKADETSIESSPDSGGGKQVATETPLAASAPDSAFDLQAALNDVQNIRKNLASMWDPDLEPIASDAERMLTGQTPLTPDAYRGIKTRYDSYLEGSAWQKANSARYNLKPDERVTYFCLEYGLTEQMNTYGGGLGILAGDHLRGASDRYSQGTFVAVGMAWKKGYFKQEISGGRQREGYKVIPFEKYAERVRVTGDDGKERDLVIKIESKDQEETRDGKRMSVEKYIYAKAWRVRVGRVELYLLDTDIDENKNPAMSPLSPNPHDITTNLYLADDREWRFKQEYLLGLGGVRLLQALGIRLAALHLNEGHAAFAAVELVKCELEKRAKALDLSPTEAADIRKKDPEKARRLGIDFSQAVAAVKPRVGFTSHTPISAGNEMFEPWIVEPYFKKYCELHGIEYNAFIGLCVERGWMTANLSRLAISLSADVTPEEAAKAILERVVVTRNGVSIKGGEVSKLLYGEGSFGAITNSVHRRFWQAKPMRDLLESRWQDLQAARSVPAKRLEELSMAERQKHLKTLLANITDDELMQVRKRMKEEAIEHLAKVRGVKLDKDAFTIVISRRFALYKRLGMILNVDDWKTVMAEDFQGQILDRLIQSARENGLPLQIVFAGKAHPQDREPQDVMAKVLKAMEVSRWRDVIKFVPDYDIEVAKDLIQIATVWENNPIPPQEACGTSGEKVAANGGLNVSSPDGWELEADPQSTVFLFGEEGSYEDIERVRDRNVRRELDARDLRELEELYTGPWRDQGTDHEKGIINMYRHHPERWAQRMRGAIYDYMVNFDMPRFMEDYESKMYIPLVQGGRYADLHPDRMATTTPSGKVAAEAWETIAKNPLLMVAISAVRELGRRTNVRHQEFFGIVEKFVPPSMVNLLQAMSQLRPITERTGVTDGELAVAIKSVKDRLSLSFDEESILWLAMTGPGQDIVRGNGSGGEGRAAAAKGDGGKAGSVSGEKAAPPAKKDETSAESKSRIAGTGMAGGREAGQLFTLVENTLNSERSKAVSAAKALGSLLEARFNAGTAEPAFTLGVDASAADAKSAIEGLISEAERLLGGSMPDDIGGVVSLLKNSVGRIEADSLVASMIAMARRANIEGRHLVIGVETGWMSGYGGEKASQQKAMRPLIQEIEQLGAKLRSLGLDNVTVIHKEGDELADALLSTSRSTDTPLSNVVVLAAKSTVDSNAFAALRSEPGREGAFIAAVDPAELVRYAREHGDSTELLNIKVVEMLCIALELASGKEPPHTPLIINYDKGRRIVVFLPKAEPVDFGKAKSIYDAQKTALAAA